MKISPVTSHNFSLAVDLLKQNNLPTEDIISSTPLFALYEENELIGTVGLEYEGKNALLRSLSTSLKNRGKGGGKLLVQFIEDFAREKGIEDIYLLTTTAADFFDKKNYIRISRADVPATIRRNAEFTSLCPASAVVMKKNLS